MGSQIGVEYALGGHEVTYLVRDLEASRTRVDRAFGVAVAAGIASTEERTAAEARIALTTAADALDPATEVIAESIPEDIDVKRAVLGPLVRRHPKAIVASNTSSIPLTELGEALGAPERTLGAHYWNPPLLMPPVEIISGKNTAPEAVERIRALIEGLGKEPVLVESDVPGFIWNRLQLALLREALWLVENGVATPRTVDLVVSSGLARRSRYTGPFETIALGGVDAWTQVAANLFPVLSAATAPVDLTRWLDRTPDELAAIRERRDAGLASELAESRTESR
jgi:3-hydroxyacyl-CoA dehydrogenase